MVSVPLFFSSTLPLPYSLLYYLLLSLTLSAVFSYCLLLLLLLYSIKLSLSASGRVDPLGSSNRKRKHLLVCQDMSPSVGEVGLGRRVEVVEKEEEGEDDDDFSRRKAMSR